jgi:hypothetical protein
MPMSAKNVTKPSTSKGTQRPHTLESTERKSLISHQEGTTWKDKTDGPKRQSHECEDCEEANKVKIGLHDHIQSKTPVQL